MSDIVNNNNEKTQMNVKETMAITVALTVNDKQMLVLAKKSDPVHVWVYFFLQHPEKNTFYQVYVDGNRLIPFTPLNIRW